MKFQSKTFVIWFLKLALSAGFLSAVADRFGLWGAAGTAGVVWGNFEAFIAYTETLNPLAPKSFIPALAWLATIFEVVLGILLLTKFKQKYVALASGVLLLVFAISMVCVLGLKAPLDYSVFSASAAAFALFILI